MARRLKLVAGLSTLAIVGALTLAACGGEEESKSAEAELEQNDAGREAGESRTGSSEGKREGLVRNGDPGTDDVAYMKLLGLARGHLAAFYELHHGGAIEMAKAHVKHPESELYSQLSTAFKARKLPGFSDQLKALAEAAAARGDIDQEYSAVIAALDSHTPVTGTTDSLLAISEIVRTAAEEFEAGVEDTGAVSNPHKYQDAYGFLVASRDMLSSIVTKDVNETDAISLAHEQIEAALASFHGLTVETTEGRASTLYGAAARIEIAARGLS